MIVAPDFGALDRPRARPIVVEPDGPVHRPDIWYESLVERFGDRPSDYIDRREDRLAAALAYAERGWHVFPVHSVSEGRCSCGKPACDSPGKHPRTQHGLKDATADRGQIIRWWQTWPDANIGCATEPSGLVVIDIDLKSGGDRTWAALVNELGASIGMTQRSRTGGGGAHCFFLRPEGTFVRSGNAKLGAGVDVKAAGGYVVLAPSDHVSGGRYEWEILSAPEPAPLPGVLLQRLTEVRQTAATSLTPGSIVVTRPPLDPTQVLQGVPHGERDDTLYRLAGRMRRDNVPQPYAEEFMKIAAANCYDPQTGELDPFPVQLAIDKVRRIYSRYPPGGAEEDIQRGAALTLGRYQLISYRDFRRERLPEFLIRDTLTAGCFAELYGAPGSFKSFLVLDIGLAVAGGYDWHGRRVKQGIAVYVCGEGQMGLMPRVEAWAKHHGREVPNDFYVIGEPVPLVQPGGAQALVETLHDLAEPPVLVIIDTLARSFVGGNENQQEDMTTFVEAIGMVQRATGAAAIVVHHENRSGGARGSIVLDAAVDYKYHVERLGAGMKVVMRAEKVKDGSEDDASITLAGTSVDVTDAMRRIIREDHGLDPDDLSLSLPDEWSSLVLCPEASEAGIRAEQSDDDKACAVLIGFGPSGATDKDWKARCIQEGAVVGDNQFYNAKRRLTNAGRVVSTDPTRKRNVPWVASEFASSPGTEQK